MSFGHSPGAAPVRFFFKSAGSSHTEGPGEQSDALHPDSFLSPKAWDAIGASALIAWNAMAAIGLVILLARDWPHLDQVAGALRAASRLAAMIWLALQSYLLCVRVPPRRKLAGITPRLSALAGAHTAAILVFLPTNNRPALQLAFAILSIVGTAGSIYTLSLLGKAFSVFPQSRKLVTDGPYRIIRHPLYLCEQMVMAGVSLLHVQPWGLLIAVISFGLQIPRMTFEERVLATSFPEYRSYMQRTWRMLPGVY